VIFIKSSSDRRHFHPRDWRADMSCRLKPERGTAPVIVLLLFFSVCRLPAGFAEPQGAPGQELFQQAQQLSSEARYAEAEEALIQALQLEPSNADYHFALSNIYAALYDSWQSSPNSPQAVQLLSRLQRSLDQTLFFNSNHLAAHFNLGILHKRQERYEEARHEFRRVLELSPDLAAAWYQIGSTYQAQGFWDEAEDAYREARELSYDPYEINQTLQELQEARAAAEQSAARSPGFGGLGNSGFGSRNGMDALGGSQNLYGNVANSANQQGNSTSALPSLAAMMIQQMLSQRAQPDPNN
jgi:tetratricopeptide (TPR) repeat protein